MYNKKNEDMLGVKDFINILNNKKYEFKLYEHKPLFTVEDSRQLRGTIKGCHSKNLFLKNKKNSFFLISCEEGEEINLKKISKSLNMGNVSFAKKEYLSTYLGVVPGSVSPFALLNDKNNDVSFFLEKKIYTSELVNFHPLINNMTISMKTDIFIKFMIENNKKIHIFSSKDEIILKTYE